MSGPSCQQGKSSNPWLAPSIPYKPFVPVILFLNNSSCWTSGTPWEDRTLRQPLLVPSLPPASPACRPSALWQAERKPGYPPAPPQAAPARQVSPRLLVLRITAPATENSHLQGTPHLEILLSRLAFLQLLLEGVQLRAIALATKGDMMNKSGTCLKTLCPEGSRPTLPRMMHGSFNTCLPSPFLRQILADPSRGAARDL